MAAKENRLNNWAEDKLIQKDVCFECGATESITYHHVVPYSKGGRKTIPICERCHGLIHGKDFLKLEKLRKDAYWKRRKENPWKSGRKEGVRESLESFVQKPKVKQIIELFDVKKNGVYYGYDEIMDSVGCSKSLVYKVGQLIKEGKIELDLPNENELWTYKPKYKRIIEFIKGNGYLKNKDSIKILGCNEHEFLKCKKYVVESFNINTIQTNNTFF